MLAIKVASSTTELMTLDVSLLEFAPAYQRQVQI